jgi:hypothetical protein
MSFAATCAEELRATIADLKRLVPGSSNPHHYHEHKSEIAHRLSQIADMLEGNFHIIAPEPKVKEPARGSRQPTVTKDPNGKIVYVDWKTRRRISAPTAPRKDR